MRRRQSHRRFLGQCIRGVVPEQREDRHVWRTWLAAIQCVRGHLPNNHLLKCLARACELLAKISVAASKGWNSAAFVHDQCAIRPNCDPFGKRPNSCNVLITAIFPARGTYWVPRRVQWAPAN